MPEEKPAKSARVPNYSGNSHKNRNSQEEVVTPKDKNVTSVIQGKAIKRKKGLWRKITETFTGDDARSVGSYVLWDIAIPAFKDLVFDIIKNGAERSLYGEVRARGRNDRYGSRSSYDKMFAKSDSRDSRSGRRELSSRARSTHDFGEIVLETRVEAEKVLDTLTELIDQYDVATVNDLYDLVEITGNFTDDKWGWTNLSNARAVRVRDGYLLELPPTESID